MYLPEISVVKKWSKYAFIDTRRVRFIGINMAWKRVGPLPLSTVVCDIDEEGNAANELVTSDFFDIMLNLTV